MRNTFVDALVRRAASDERIFLVTPDMGFSVLERFRDRFPDRFLNVGIAEQNAIGVASGLALSGHLVYVYSIVPFVTMRCYEQVRNDVAYMRTQVRLIGIGGGLTYGPAGPTHHSIEDIAIMRALPNMTVCCPGDPVETRGIIERSFEFDGPMYVRLGKSGERNLHVSDARIEIGKAVTMSQGGDAALITTGNTLEMGCETCARLRREGIGVLHLSMPTVKPIDEQAIQNILASGMPLFTLEEHNVIGGLGSAVAEIVAESEGSVPFHRIGVPDIFVSWVGGQEFLREKCGMNDLENRIRGVLRG
jgi:transketolase